MLRTISLVGGTLSRLSGGAIVVALVVLLHSQFRERFPAWEGPVLVWAVLVWWVCALPLKVVENLRTRHRRGRAAAIAVYLFAWGVQGVLVVAAVARYVAGASQQPRFEAVLAALAAALIIAMLVKRAAMRWAGADVAVLPSGFAVVRWVAAIGLAGFAQPLGVLLAESVCQPPVWFYTWFDSWAWNAVGLVGAALASAVYLYVLGRITGIIQAFATERFSTTHTHGHGGMIREYTDDHDYRVPRSRTVCVRWPGWVGSPTRGAPPTPPVPAVAASPAGTGTSASIRPRTRRPANACTSFSSHPSTSPGG